MSILPEFLQFDAEAAIIGRLLAGYATLEIDLLHCVSQVTRNFDATLKAMFGDRGNAQRIGVAAKLGQQAYAKLGLGDDFDRAIDAMRYCLKIRNQYAHCNWYDDNSGQLAYVNVEELAKEKILIEGFEKLTRHHIDPGCLGLQEQYFGDMDKLLYYANLTGQFLRGETTTRYERPAELSKPPLHI